MIVSGESVTFSMFDTTPVSNTALYEVCAFVDYIDSLVENLQEHRMEYSEL